MSLLFYLCVDTLAIMTMYLGDKYRPKQSNAGFRIIKNGRIKKSSFYVGCSFMILFCVAAFRDGVGKDYTSYANAYLHVVHNTLNESEKQWLSVGFKILCKIIGVISPNSSLLLMVMISFITLLFLYKAIVKGSPNWTMSIYVFICFCLYYRTFNQLRQMLALAITTYAVVYLRQNRIKKYIILVCLAGIMHTSAFVMLSLIFVYKWEMTLKNVMIYTMASVIAYFGFDKVLYLLSFTNYGVTYLNWSKYNTTFERSSILFMFVRIIMLLGCLAFYKDLRAKDSSINVLYNMAIVCTITQLLTVRLYLFGRITTYFYVTYIFLIPEIMGLIKERYSKNKRIVLYGIIIIALLLYHFVYYYSSSGAVGSGYEVYKSVFF